MSEIVFYFTSALALISTMLVVTRAHAIHALLYLVVSLLALSLCFYLLGATFAAALQIIVYAGAIMVLFVFAVMMFDLTDKDLQREHSWLSGRYWIGPTVIAGLLLIQLLWLLAQQPNSPIGPVREVDAKQVGIALFGPYLLAVEIASFLLLAGLVGAYHIGKPTKPLPNTGSLSNTGPTSSTEPASSSVPAKEAKEI